MFGGSQDPPSSPTMLEAGRSQETEPGLRKRWVLLPRRQESCAQHDTHRGHSWGSHVGTTVCVNGSRGTQGLLVQVLRLLPL